MAEQNIEVLVQYDSLRVLINGALHVHVIRSKLLAVQSWLREAEGRFAIEFVMEGGTMLTDYDDRERWLAVLSGLKKALV